MNINYKLFDGNYASKFKGNIVNLMCKNQEITVYSKLSTTVVSGNQDCVHAI
jgi:hypothetical protein